MSFAIYEKPIGIAIRSDAELYACVREQGGAEIWIINGSQVGPRLFLNPEEFELRWQGD